MKLLDKIKRIPQCITIYAVLTILMITAAAFFVGGYGTAYRYYTKLYYESASTQYIITYPERVRYGIILDRNGISEKIQEYRVEGKLHSIAEIYNDRVQNMEITYLILDAAHTFDIPENLLFGLIWAESDFDREAYNGSNADGSNDRGLMQLNSRYFGHIDRRNPRANLIAGCSHLRSIYERTGSWDSAVMYYNGFSQKSVEHQTRVLEFERYFDKIMNYHIWYDETLNG